MGLKRGKNGRFAVGNTGGPGRPRQTDLERVETIRERLTADRWEAIVEKTIQRAEKGDHKALEWLGQRMLPEKAPDFTPPPTDDERLNQAIADADYDQRAALLKALESPPGEEADDEEGNGNREADGDAEDREARNGRTENPPGDQGA